MMMMMIHSCECVIQFYAVSPATWFLTRIFQFSAHITGSCYSRNIASEKPFPFEKVLGVQKHDPQISRSKECSALKLSRARKADNCTSS